MTDTPQRTDLDAIAAGLLEAVPMMRSWGVSVVEIEPGVRTVLHVPANDDTVGPYGAMYGGVLMTVADIAAGTCAALTWRARGLNGYFAFATQEMSCHFLGPTSSAAHVVAEPLRLSDRRAVLSVSVVEDGDVSPRVVAAFHVSIVRSQS